MIEILVLNLPGIWWMMAISVSILITGSAIFIGKEL